MSDAKRTDRTERPWWNTASRQDFIGRVAVMADADLRGLRREIGEAVVAVRAQLDAGARSGEQGWSGRARNALTLYRERHAYVGYQLAQRGTDPVLSNVVAALEALETDDLLTLSEGPQSRVDAAKKALRAVLEGVQA